MARDLVDADHFQAREAGHLRGALVARFEEGGAAVVAEAAGAGEGGDFFEDTEVVDALARAGLVGVEVLDRDGFERHEVAGCLGPAEVGGRLGAGFAGFAHPGGPVQG